MFEKFEIASFYSGNFKIFKNELGKFIPNRPPKHVITSRNFKKITQKHLYQSLFSNKVSYLQTVTLLKKRLRHRCFLVNFRSFFKRIYFEEHLRSTNSELKSMLKILETLSAKTKSALSKWNEKKKDSGKSLMWFPEKFQEILQSFI